MALLPITFSLVDRTGELPVTYEYGTKRISGRQMSHMNLDGVFKQFIGALPPSVYSQMVTSNCAIVLKGPQYSPSKKVDHSLIIHTFLDLNESANVLGRLPHAKFMVVPRDHLGKYIHRTTTKRVLLASYLKEPKRS